MNEAQYDFFHAHTMSIKCGRRQDPREAIEKLRVSFAIFGELH